ncbi:MAG: cation diffusion facilitator family transporter [Anaerolineales bacterium]|nr:cation diffusion facilitator family transporter [Anaerolineales bacterium]
MPEKSPDTIDNITLDQHYAEKEKRTAALSSVAAAIFLTSMKLVVGLLTNSLGILSEAAHSALDLAAAAITYAAVKISDRQPDRNHPYGFGKVENLSALVETLLLFVTCIWIIYEAVQRLFFKSVHVEASIWSFIVMGISIIIDVTRSRMLMKTAKKHNSQALEADALHFSTDVWSSSVVIAGLVAVAAADWLKTNTAYQLDWLKNADAVAALGVSGLVIYVSWQLGKRAVAALVDSAPQGMLPKIEQAILKIPGISTVERVRVRHSGPALFADVTIALPRSTSFEEAHQIASQAEQAIQALYPRSDVMVHVDPTSPNNETLVERLWSIASQYGLSVHSIRAYDVRDAMSLELHTEVPENLTLHEAHNRVTEFEAKLRQEIHNLDEIVTHIEPVGDQVAKREVFRLNSDQINPIIHQVAGQLPGVTDCHNIRTYLENESISLSFHCKMDPEISINDAHEITVQFENLLRTKIPELGRTVIHLEPADEGIQ